jgi:hypothetical protein
MVADNGPTARGKAGSTYVDGNVTSEWFPALPPVKPAILATSEEYLRK